MINLKHAAPILFMISFACYHLQVEGSHQHICTNPQRHTREYGSSDFSGYNGLTYMACSQQCQATGRNHMQWWYDEEPTAIAGGTGNCVCLGNIAGTTFASRGIYCQMSSYGTGAVNGQWSPWTTWTGKCALKSTSTNPQMKRTRLCNKFPPSFNSGRSSCGGSSVDNVRGGACLESKMDYYVTKNQGINVPAGTTITASFTFEYKLIEENNDQEFSLYVSAKKMNANQTAAELGLVLGNFGCVKSASESLDLPNEDFCLSSVEKDSNDQVYRRITKKDTFKSTTMVETDHKLTWDYNYKMTAATERQERYITTIFHMKDQTSKMERIFVKQFAHKIDISSPVQQIYSFRAKFMRHNNHFTPGFLFWMRFEYHRQDAGTTRVWNIVSKVYSPQILLDKTSLVVPAGEIGESQHFHNPRGPMTYMYKYMDPTFTSSRFLDFQFDYPLNEMTLFVGKSHTMRNFMDYTYCVHGDDICSDVYKLHFETKSEESEPEIIYGGQEFFMDLNKKRFRLRHAKTGACLYMDKSTTAYFLKQSTSRCKNSKFFYDQAGRMKFIDDGSSEETFLSSFKNDIKKTTSKADLFNLYITKRLNQTTGIKSGKILTCWRKERAGSLAHLRNVDGQWGHTGTQKPEFANELFDDESNEDNDFLKLPVWPGMENMILKGIVMATTSLGETMFVCALKADLVQKSNCFLTTDQGLSWKGLSPFFTYFEFIVTSTDYVYGKCLHAKYYCRMKIEHTLTDQRNELVSEADYIAKLISLDSSSVNNLDSTEFTGPMDAYDNFPDYTVDGKDIFKSGGRILTFGMNG